MDEIKTIDSLPQAPESTRTIFDKIDEAPIEENVASASGIDQDAPPTIEKALSVEPDPGQSPSAKHFKAVRDLKEQAERERDEAIKYAQRLEAQFANVPKTATNPEDDSEFQIGNDELAEGKHLKAVVNEVKKLKNQLKQYESQSSTSIMEARLKMEHPDIEKVVSKENVEILGIQYPELAATLEASKGNLYNQAKAAYTLIKKLGIQPEDNYQEDRTRAAVNAAKPRPLTSVNPQQGDSPLSHANAFANGLTPELKASLLKEMLAARQQ